MSFKSPNYTQTPNELFDELLPEMGLAELKVTLCVIRHTLGYHRDEVKLSIREIARLTGLTPRSVLEGAKAAKKRGIIHRSVSSNMTATWLAVIAEDTPRATKYNATVSPSIPLVGHKKSKEIKKKESARPLDFKSMTVAEAQRLPTLRMYADATDFFPGSIIWEFVDKFITENKLTAEKITAAAVAWAMAGYKRENVKGILEWAVSGIPEKHQVEIKKQAEDSYNPYASLIKHMQKMEAQNE